MSGSASLPQQAQPCTCCWVTQLCLAGSIRYKRLQLRPTLLVEGLSVVQPAHIGGHTVLEAAKVEFGSNTSLLTVLTGRLTSQSTALQNYKLVQAASCQLAQQRACRVVIQDAPTHQQDLKPAAVAGRASEVRVSGVSCDCMSDEDGLLHVVVLLQGVKYWRELKTDEQPSEVPPPKHERKKKEKIPGAGLQRCGCCLLRCRCELEQD